MRPQCIRRQSPSGLRRVAPFNCEVRRPAEATARLSTVTVAEPGQLPPTPGRAWPLAREVKLRPLAGVLLSVHTLARPMCTLSRH
jgi:hypothetical protein